MNLVRVKVNISVRLLKRDPVEAYGRVASIRIFLTLELDGGEWLALPSGRFTAGKGLSTHWI